MAVVSKNRRWLGLLSALWLLLLPLWASAQLVASLDRQQISLDDSVQLQLRYQGTAQEQPDFSALTADFDIISRSQRTVMNWRNGQQQQSVSWVLLLSPKRSGELQIPALQLQGESSAPLTLSVAPRGEQQESADPAANAEPPLFMLADINPTSGFEQSELRYRLRIFSVLNIREGNLSQPEVDGLQLSPDGDEKRYNEQRNGREYQVIERSYRVVAQRSGELQIPEVTLDARVSNEQGSYRSAMDLLFDAGRVMRVRSNPVTVNIKPRPAAVKGWFLPATAVNLSQRWQPQPPQFEVGKAISRIIRLEAQGATPTQLPQLKLSDIPDVRQYLEQVDRRSETSAANGAVAVLEQTVSLIPLQPGPLTLPELRVEWWDITSDSAQVAVLPAMTVQVVGEAATVASGALDAPIKATTEANVKGKPATDIHSPAARSNWLPVLLSVIVAGAVMALLGWLLRRYRLRANSPLNCARRQLLRACREHDAARAQQALQLFFAAGGQLPASAQTQLEQLYAALYRPTCAGRAAPPWRGDALADALASRRATLVVKPRLPPLYPY